ncbi:hypothetical protein CHUAL_003745 [Chamberlinius hualienensis]
MNVDDLVEHFLRNSTESEEWYEILETEYCQAYRKTHEDAEIFEIKMYSTIDNVTPEMCLEFNQNIECRKMWDQNVVEMYEVPESGHIYIETTHGWPLWNREHVYKNQLREIEFNGQPCYMIISYSVEPENPPKPSTVRCLDFWGITVIFKNREKENTVKTIFHVYDKPGFNIYNWLADWTLQCEIEKGYHTVKNALLTYISEKYSTAENPRKQEDYNSD